VYKRQRGLGDVYKRQDLSGGLKFISYDRFPLEIPFSFRYFGPASIADFLFYFGFNL
jgi:hypothetical protein